MSDTVLVALIGAGATVLAAIIAVIAKIITSRPPPPPVDAPREGVHGAQPTMNLTGRYMGDNGDLWALKATVELLGSHAKGRMHWTLVECPPELPWAKHVGRSGYEFVEGSWDQDCMNLTGLKVSDTDATFLTLAHYNLVFDSGFRTFEGTARAISNTEYKKWGGAKLRGTVTPST